MKKVIVILTVLILISALILACGGGGGKPTPTPIPYPTVEPGYDIYCFNTFGQALACWHLTETPAPTAFGQ